MVDDGRMIVDDSGGLWIAHGDEMLPFDLPSRTAQTPRGETLHFDVGHDHGWEHRSLAAKFDELIDQYEPGLVQRKDVLDFYASPDHLSFEPRSRNRSRRFEADTLTPDAERAIEEYVEGRATARRVAMEVESLWAGMFGP